MTTTETTLTEMGVAEEMEARGIPLLRRTYQSGWTHDGPDEPLDAWRARMIRAAVPE